MVDCVEAVAPAPPVLSLAWQCAKWGVLPAAGGMLDQDYALIRSMTAAENIYNAVYRFRHLSGKRIHELTDFERKVLRMLKDLGLMFHA